MANKKITELPYITGISGSTIADNPLLNTVVPVVLYGTTNQINIENFSRFMNLYTATTGSAGNIFVGPQTINNNVTINGNQAVNGNVSISGRLTVNEVVAQYETASILFSTGSTKLGDQITDKHEFTGSTNITGSFIVNGANLTDFSASNSATFTNFSSSNSATFTNYSSSNSTVFTNYSSSNSTVFTNFSSSNSTLFTNTSSSINNRITAVSSSINTTLFAVSSSTNTTLLEVSSSINNRITEVSSSIDSTIKANLGATNETIYRIQQATASIQSYTSSLKGAIDVNGAKVGLGGPASSSYGVYITTDVNDGSLGIDSSADINALYLLKNGQKRFEYSVDTTAGANITRLLPYTSNGFFEIGNPSNASNNNTDYVFISENTYGNVLIGPGIPNATANLTGATATIHKVQLRGNTFIAGDLKVTGSTTLGDTNTDKVEVTGSVNVTGYVSASGINIYSTGTPEILSTNNLRLTADSSVVITTDNSGTAKVWDFDNGGTINLPGGATISTPNTVDVIVAAGSAGAAQLSNFNKSNYFAINDTLATINVDAGATNKVWQFTNVGSINLPGSIVKPDGGEYSASLTLTSSFHAFTASIGSTSNDYRIELNSIEAYTASLKSAAIVSSSTQVQNYDVFALNSNLYNGTGSLQAQLNGLMAFTASLDNTYATDAQLNIVQSELNGVEAYTASLKGQAIVSSSTQIQNYDVFALNSNLYESTGSIKGEIAGIEAYTASLKSVALVSGSLIASSSYSVVADGARTIDISTTNTDTDAYPLFANVIGTTGVGVLGDSGLRYNAFTNTLSVIGNISATTYLGNIVSSSAQIGEIAGLQAYTASLKSAAIVSSSQQIKDYITFVENSRTASMTVNSATYAALISVNTDSTDTTLYPVFTSNIASNGSVGLRGHTSGTLYYNGLTQQLIVSGGGLVVTGSSNTTGSINLIGTQTITGSLRITGSLTINSGSITMPNRPAFRVVGTSSTDRVAQTTLSGSYTTVHYNEGNHYNNSTGIFTAPIAGLYNIYFNGRVGSVNAQQQVIVYKNGEAGVAQLMWEAAGNTGAVHFGVNGISKLEVGDTLEAKVAIGSIQFDGNDSFGATYIG